MERPSCETRNRVHGSNLCVYDPLTVDFGKNVTIEYFVEIQDHCVIGNHVTIRSFCRIGHGCRIGEHSTLKNGVILSPDIYVGPHVFIAPNVVFMNDQQKDSAGTAVLAHVFIGTGAIIAPGVTIDEHCFIAAGTHVNRDCESGKAYGGVPMRELSKSGPEMKRRVFGV